MVWKGFFFFVDVYVFIVLIDALCKKGMVGEGVVVGVCEFVSDN